MIYLKRFGLLLAMAGMFMSFSIGSVSAQEKEDRGSDKRMERTTTNHKKVSRTARRRHSRFVARNTNEYNRRHKAVRRENENDHDKN